MAEKVATRHAYGEALREFGADPRIVALDADVATCTMSIMFGREYADRFYNVGIAESNMIGMAAGMSTLGKIPFLHAFAMFCAGRGYDQIRNSICYPELNVKIVGTHAGLTVGEDGATHQCLEDLALMRVIPGMTVISPADGNETREAVRAMIEHEGPVYLRLGRMAVERCTQFEGYRFEIGKAVKLREGKSATIIANGIMVGMAIEAAKLLEAEGIDVRVVNMHTIKPIDKGAVVAAARETGAIVTAEEHNVIGGLGAAVAEVVVEECLVPVCRVGTNDAFGRSGDADALLKMYGLTPEAIVQSVRRVIARK